VTGRGRVGGGRKVRERRGGMDGGNEEEGEGEEENEE
jgi:hypothetical protein